MKKVMFLFLLGFISMGVNAQKIKVNEVDKFTKKQIIETSFEKISSSGIKPGGTGLRKDVWIACHKNGENEYLRIKWCTDKVIALSKDADVIFLDKDGNTYTFKNTEFTVAGSGEGTVGMWGSALYGLNMYFIGDVLQLKDKTVTDMRINTTDGYVDYNISESSSKTISKTITVFENEVIKTKQ